MKENHCSLERADLNFCLRHHTAVKASVKKGSDLQFLAALSIQGAPVYLCCRFKHCYFVSGGANRIELAGKSFGHIRCVADSPKISQGRADAARVHILGFAPVFDVVATYCPEVHAVTG